MTTAAGTTTSTIGSLITGVDTNAIVQGLVTAAKVPEQAVQARATAAQNQLTAYQDIGTDMASLQVLSAQISTSSGWGARGASSTNTSTVAVTASDGAPLGSLSFTVDQLAAAHSVVGQSNITDLTTVIASSGSVGLTVGGVAHTLSVGNGSLDSVASAINSAKLGLTATEVNTGSGYRLQISSNSTGAASTFTIDSGLDSNVGGMAITTQGQDASLTIGSGAGAYSVTSSSNTFSKVMAGVTITAKAKSTDPVTVSITSDAQALATQIQNMVDAANKVLTDIQSDTNYNTNTSTASVLTGDSTVARIQQALTSALTNPVSQSSLNSPANAGLSMDATGSITFDQDAFIAAFQANPDDVQSMFVQGGTSTSSSMTFVAAGATAQAGSADVVVTQAATRATDTGLVGSWPQATPPAIQVKVGSTTATYQVQATDSAADAAAGLQAALKAAGVGVTAALNSDGTGITLTSVGYGSASQFSVAWDGTNFTADAGTDVAGTINGVTATGVGRQLSLPSTDPTFGGLSVTMNDDSTGAIGTITYEPGVAQRVSSQVSNATNRTNGYLVSAENGLQKSIDSLNSTVSAMDLRVQALQDRLTKQFSTLQATLSRLKDMSNFLASQIDSLPTIGGASSSDHSSSAL
jgi:flagellar hook-associated protein 2